MKTASRLNWKVRLAFGSAILALLVAGAISYRGMAVSSESDRWVRHTHEVLENLQDLRSAIESIEPNCYIHKPMDLGMFLVVKSIDSFWLSVVKLPQPCEVGS